MASRAPLTTRPARARCVSSVNLASSSSALARTTPSWLLRRWNTRERSGDSSMVAGRGVTPVTAISGATTESLLRPGRIRIGGGRRFGVAPQRVFEDPDRPASRPDVLNLAARQPVVDGPSAHTHKFTCTWNRNSLPFKQHLTHPAAPWLMTFPAGTPCGVSRTLSATLLPDLNQSCHGPLPARSE